MKKLAISLLIILCSFSFTFAQSGDAYTVQVDTTNAYLVSYRINHLGIGEDLRYDRDLAKIIMSRIKKDNNYKRESALKLLLNCLDDTSVSNMKYVFFMIEQTWDGRIISLRVGMKYENTRPILCDETCRKLIIEWESEHIFPNWNNELGKMTIFFSIQKDEIIEAYNSLKAEKSNNDNSHDFTAYD